MKKERKKMLINGLLDINNLPEIDGQAYVVVVNDNGTLWKIGVYDEIEKAQAAVEEDPEYRFMVTVE